MPKIIENIREKLLEEAKKQVREQGYSSMTIRSVATACGVGTGTVYNYFPSKDMLVASFMLEDWMQCIQVISEEFEKAESIKDALYGMYQELLKYKEKYTNLFMDENAEASYTASSMQRHHLLREQLAEPIKMWTRNQDKVDAEFLAEFIAENMLTLTMASKDFELIASVILQLF
ncbi:MAG: TetR/AcrR family transcriptional regulator [Agathobacter sp.]|nr:TetR/AcrR family transcriptional regulator [Agathobacter sp.]